MNLKRIILFLGITILMSSQTLIADNHYRSKLGFDVRGYKGNLDKTIGWLVGARYANYVGSSQFYVGLSANFGTPSGKAVADERFYYGGLLLGIDARISKIFIFEGSLVLGAGEGRIIPKGISEKSYFAAEPSLGLGFSLGGGWRLCFAGSYVHMSSAARFSGATFGLRLQFRNDVVSKDIND